MSAPLLRAQILVLGAGPAGCAAAIGLARLGYTVAVAGDWRRFQAIEGVSSRTLQGLRQAGLLAGAATAPAPVPRIVHWAGNAQAANQEHLLDRQQLDAGLRQDLQREGVHLLASRILAWEMHDSGHTVRLQAEGRLQTVHADFVIEARGRLAPVAAHALRGPQTLSLLHAWQDAPGGAARAGAARIGIESMEQGWAWMACLPDGRRYWQCTLDPEHSRLPARDQLAAWSQAWRGTALARQVLGELPAPQRMGVTARACTAMRSAVSGGAHWLRVGDAAMAVDPLSGNGIFQSLSSALQAPAVVHTLMQQPDSAALALQFHAQRIEQLFLRFARTGRDFYAQENRWPAQAFWQRRAAWPDRLPAHGEASAQALRIALRPVVDGQRIRQAEVVVSPDQPLGMWQVAGVELAPLVGALLRLPDLPGRSAWMRQQLPRIPAASQAALLGWMRSQGLL